MLSIVMLNVIMPSVAFFIVFLNVVNLSVFMVSVVAPFGADLRSILLSWRVSFSKHYQGPIS